MGVQHLVPAVLLTTADLLTCLCRVSDGTGWVMPSGDSPVDTSGSRNIPERKMMSISFSSSAPAVLSPPADAGGDAGVSPVPT